MIPIQLSLQGVYSYQQKQTIDFQSLTDAGLFGIFGKVGSGKSSIIEAITYVLYGESQRLGKNGFNYNITNLRSDNLEIDYIFTIANQRFRFKANGKRQKQFNSVKIERNAWKWESDTNDWIPIEPNAEAVLELKYNDFRRTVIIPQGNFQEFLELSKVERSTMMQTLFGLEKFDLSDNTKKLKEQNDLIINTLETQLTELGAFSQDAIADLEKEQKETETAIKHFETQLKEVHEIEQNLKQLLADIKEATAKKEKLTQLQARLPIIEQKKLQLKTYRDVFTFFKPAYDNLVTLQNEVKEALKELEVAKNQHITSIELVKKLKTQEQILGQEYAQKDDLKAKAEDYFTIAKIINLNQALFAIKETKVKQAKQAEKLQTLVKSEKENSLSLQERKTKLKVQNIDIQSIINLLHWYEQYESLKNEKNELWQKANIEHEKEQQLNVQKLNFNSSLISSIDENTSFEAITLMIENELNSIKAKIEENEQQKISFSQRMALFNHAHTLIDGEPCPLCGSAHHPNRLIESENWETLLQENQRQKSDYQKAEKLLVQQKIDIARLITISQNIDNEKNSLKIQFEEKKKAISEHEAKFNWQPFDMNDKSEAIEAQIAFNNWTKELENIEIQIQQIQQKIEQHEDNLRNQIEPELRNIELKEHSINTELLLLQKQIKSLQIADYLEFSEAEINTKANQLLQKSDKITVEYEAIKVNLQKEQTNESSHATKVEQLQLVFDKIQAKQEQANSKVIEALQTLNLEAIADAIQILAQQLNIQTEEQAIESFGQNLKIAEHEYQLAQEKVVGKDFSEEQFNDNQLNIKSLKQSIGSETQKLGSLKKQIDQAKSNLERQQKLQIDLNKATLRRENLATLDSLFRGQGFVNYASKVYLQNLIAIANERFMKMTQRQLKLQLTNDNDFEVLDLLNGGRNRSVKTLSGGQKFQASLCLALALTDSISGAHRENFFFLDEGFGALDKNALQVVFETLQSLRKENRVIGIISHVEDMQQEIENYIHVELDEEKGSIVEVI